ncbi:N-acetylmuramoyl-L-alanine amidase [Lentibacter sp. XHP0401]|uniref:N-acetylmuramoyl-L-alanine amidase n=1 Tax=Lentibacter sp. XHP0401 TaxID=2984334 RepID=UPI0021E8A7A3|nr:N-acetylmuramoyl-L-alanine amidase [Lentibacter sp. XHP0401]MCV2891774.1 N-acetylmuramoyl-L-alanine amidase [Lentibacter sp. XHP0401]
MSRLFAAITLGFALLWGGIAVAQSLSGLARVDTEASGLRQSRQTVTLTLALSQPVPYRVYTLDTPQRLVLDFREVDWSGVTEKAFGEAAAMRELRFGGFRPGWSRMVAELAAPYALDSAQMTRNADTGQAELVVRLKKSTPEAFAAQSGPPKGDLWPEPLAPAPPKANDRVLVVLDPGHGGIDPGASRDGQTEKDLMLTFAREIAEELGRLGAVDVLLTRTDDSFVSLERRVAMAHQAGADLFISLHADALAEGRAHGATVHTLADDATDEATALLAERHDRADLLSGTDLSGQDDIVADVLLDLARQETEPRTERLARAIIGGLESKGAPLNRRPYRAAAFSVLKAADIPSVLLEIGFLSSDRDFTNIINATWRRSMAEGLRDGIQAWIIADEAVRGVVRQ